MQARRGRGLVLSMTLITYLTRVHFADGVLEEAIWSELEAAKYTRPLIIFDSSLHETPTMERLLSSLPVRTRAHIYSLGGSIAKEVDAFSAARVFDENSCDCLVAFGSATAIDLAKAARVVIAHWAEFKGASVEPNYAGLSSYTENDGGSRRIGQNLPDLIAIPGILGFSSAINMQAPIVLRNGKHAVLSCKRLMPKVAICDPTLTVDASKRETASAGVAAISECIEAIVSRGYNPPAEGIAHDGLSRAIRNLPIAMQEEKKPKARREMMAASLNASLALQKGLGASKAISNALQSVSDHGLDRGVLHRIALPLVLAFNEQEKNDRLSSLSRLFGAKNTKSLSDNVESFFKGLGLPSTFGEVGLKYPHFESAARIAQDDVASQTNPRSINSRHYLTIMQEAQ